MPQEPARGLPPNELRRLHFQRIYPATVSLPAPPKPPVLAMPVPASDRVTATEAPLPAPMASPRASRRNWRFIGGLGVFVLMAGALSTQFYSRRAGNPQPLPTPVVTSPERRVPNGAPVQLGLTESGPNHPNPPGPQPALQVSEDITIGGSVVIAKGAEVTVEGRDAGNPALLLLTAVAVDGTRLKLKLIRPGGQWLTASGGYQGYVDGDQTVMVKK